MSVVTGVLRDLVLRRLWPVAVLLIAVAVAAPVFLASEPEVAAPPAGSSAGAAEAVPVASLVEDFAAGTRRRVLGIAKDPFRPSGRQPTAGPSSTAGPAGTPANGAPVRSAPPAGAPGLDAGGGAVPGGPSPVAPSPGGPVAPVPAPTADPGTTERYDLYSLKVKLDDGEPFELERLEPLLVPGNPLIIYLGLLQDGKTAVFLLDAGVTTDGDGSCRPSPEDCRRVHLRKGETQFFDVPSETGEGAGASTSYQLDLVGITVKTTTSARKARTAYASSSKRGRRALRSRAARIGRLDFDQRTGLLRQLTVKAHRSAVIRQRIATARATVARATPR